ncbi:MAG: hypothetical protein ABMA25_04630 [Ilumatobacteraceae bacterium]
MTIWNLCTLTWVIGVFLCVVSYSLHFIRWLFRRRRPVVKVVGLGLLVIVVSLLWSIAFALSFRKSVDRGAESAMERVWMQMVRRIGEADGEVAALTFLGRSYTPLPPPGPADQCPDPLINDGATESPPSSRRPG